ncbi:deoxyribonuclease-1-like [Uloborus diversus]|uniref:deoxyribonuclease-1-like n=1 Tax=Uloborus diversus TaxID=327109 RepID=UPI0024090181|nr:deoxyribonuclease-1-like [Uloborus diversus]
MAVLINYSFASVSWTKNSVEKPLSVGAFNIQNLGNSKLGNATIMNIVKQVILRYDLVLIQEIVTQNEKAMQDFLKDLNKLTDSKSKYKMEISERLGRGTAKEQYAYLYRADRLNLVRSKVYPDEDDLFMRPPFIALFTTPTLRDVRSMLAIGVHTQPKNAANETSSMATVYDYAKEEFKVEDAIMMGDMNAGCANVRMSDWKWIELWNRQEFFWHIGHDRDTTVSPNCCPYDRIVTAGLNMEDAVIEDSAGPFNFKDEYGLTTEMALDISDHWPVEVKLRGGTSSTAHENISPKLCVTVEDKSTKSIPEGIRNQRTTYGFSIQISEDQALLSGQASDDDDLLARLQKVGTRYPELVSQEAVDTVVYKVEHGAVVDVTSHMDVPRQSYTADILFDVASEQTSIEFCAATTVN